jgi:hypothetical protein
MGDCVCGHSVRQHEIRGSKFGCFIDGCLCIDHEPVKPKRTAQPDPNDHGEPDWATYL